MKKDDPLDAVAGIVTAVYERKTGTGNFGPWAIQNLYIGDGERTIKVMLRNSAEVMQEGKGHKVYILAGVGKNGKPCGLKVGEDTYQGKTSIIVSANDNATVTFDEPDYLASAEPSEPATHSHPAPAAPAVPPVAAPPPLVQTPLPTPPPTATAPAPAKPAGPRDTRAAWAQVDHELNALRRIRLRSLAAAHAVRNAASLTGIHITPDHFQVIDSWMAIAMEKKGFLINVPDCDPPNVAGE